MSTAYKPLFNIRFENIFDARLDKYEVREQIRTDTSDSTRYLAGPDGVLAVFSEQNGASSSFVRPSFEPMPWSTFDALNREFDTEFVSEHDHRFWGFDTAKEWDQFQNEITRGENDDFYIDLIRYARGEPNGLIPGTVGFEEAEIAKTLIERDANLAKPEARDALFAALNEIYQKRPMKRRR
jgi:hypothetical protein